MTTLSAKDVVTFLKQNPDFVQHNKQLIVALEATRKQPPFHARQLEVLRQRHSTEQAKFQMVVDSAHNNQALEHSLYLFAQKLLLTRKSKVSERMLKLERIISQQFALEQNRIFLATDCIGQNPPAKVDYTLLAPRVAHGSSICDDRVSKQQMNSIFGNHHDIKSCAFVPLPQDRKAMMGVMVFGSSDVERFQPGMGAIYLDRIGGLVGAFLVGA